MRTVGRCGSSNKFGRRHQWMQMKNSFSDSTPTPEIDRDAHFWGLTSNSNKVSKATSKGGPIDIPTIDLSALAGDADQVNRVTQDIHQACQEWGFFKVVGHGIPDAVIQDTYAVTRDFFLQPKDVKQKVKRSEDNARGWFDDEFTKQTRDWKEGFDFGHKPHPELDDEHPDNRCMDGCNRWPATPPQFKGQLQQYYDTVHHLAVILTEIIAVGLGGDKSFFKDKFDKHTSFLRLNYYPTCSDSKTLGVNPHKDAGFLTILSQDSVAALQVFHDGEWINVQPEPGAFIINVGDMCQVMSNDVYLAPLHRVLSNTSKDRISMPFFYNPNYDADAVPIPSSVAPKYRPVNWGEFRSKRFEGDYSDKGTEVQITHYLL
eukprot:CAMPEP_0174379148 /NCGR_PEP_ID=MMETSP0811_2-20130205/122517_1 /TAXON_ID=73025 ORGANISM="Eutreptiella gymnastica-like, Strain CCMP1594" /NCGR_SAMPLE_ID=MMETSP0811_2 /ASSEMBLY_ACC=CAM_ASM_000667 /LENGTH=373 /DNA_ID=CAMNT_0015531591 /DNA_START=119 /DNA_END=1240 /DNA_ORIENTATION=-